MASARSVDWPDASRRGLFRLRAIHRVYLLLALILAMGCAGIVWSPDGEFFPFASFSLFSVVPNVRTAYALEIRRLSGEPLDPPRLWLPVRNQGPESTSSETFYAVQRLGKAYTEGRQDQAEYWRHLLEADFLSLPASYDLVKASYDPLELLSGGSVKDEQVLASFVVDH